MNLKNVKCVQINYQAENFGIQYIMGVKATGIYIPLLTEETLSGNCFLISKNNLSADFNFFSIFKSEQVVKKTFPEIYST